MYSCQVVIASGLPKPQTCKMMRQFLRKIFTQDVDRLGDISTLADSAMVKDLIQLVDGYYSSRAATAVASRQKECVQKLCFCVSLCVCFYVCLCVSLYVMSVSLHTDSRISNYMK